jgi:hypothetical protein
MMIVIGSEARREVNTASGSGYHTLPLANACVAISTLEQLEQVETKMGGQLGQRGEGC